ncbi:MAG: SprT family zinc-dependent metalloprotease [Hoeflea sp.]|uniref:M48 family metallopeptidase n=1 Tax=Hoeflea sp. TaxID=1940281 RepID=UPI002730D37D|nr:SprT family zinc-dependent metalloprotease [Hoeflea sp.]MDP2120297.1 SprT family zinc-dependent metalloprotease [Hoeflea sp.]
MFGFGRSSPKSSTPRPAAVTVNGRALPLIIRENARATRMTLRIEPGGQALKLTIPRGLPAREIDEFLTRHHGWLMTRLARVPDAGPLAQDRMIAIRGVDHRIEMTGKLRGLAEETEIDGQPTLMVSGSPEHVGRRVSDHLKKVARHELDPMVRHHAATLGKPVRAIAYKDTRSRWGSCTSDGNLSFSWRIAMAPVFVIDYLAAHEVAHLKEMNHGPDFWATCTALCPRTKEAKRWLKQNGSRLFAVTF